MYLPTHQLINSQDRDLYSNQSPSNFNINLPTSIKNASNLVLVSALIPYTFYNITSNNNTFTIDSNLITISPGNYNLNEVGAAIQTQVQALGGTYSAFVVGFNNITSQGYFQNGTAFAVNFTNSNIANLLGFNQQSYSSTTFLNSQFPINIQTLNILIHIDICSSVSTTSSSAPSATFVIPVNVNKAEYIYFNSFTQFQAIAKTNSSIINSLQIRVTDFQGNVLQGLGEWYCILQFEYRSDVNIKLCSD